MSAHIEVSGKGKSRKIKSFLVSRSRGETIYKSEYESSKDNMFIYHSALDALKEHADIEGLEIVSVITNLDLPVIHSTGKRMR